MLSAVVRGQVRLQMIRLNMYNKNIYLHCKTACLLWEQVGKAFKNYETLIASVYNESIAMAIRKGALLAGYSIDRRCMQNYVRDLVKDDTCALICIVCARRFPYVSHKPKYENLQNTFACAS